MREEESGKPKHPDRARAPVSPGLEYRVPLLKPGPPMDMARWLGTSRLPG